MPGAVDSHGQGTRGRLGMNFQEQALAFDCDGSWLYGILSLPEHPFSRGVLIVVGGPQYRVGSHRQFTLLARHLAAQGISVMRFDYRGMGDSEGEARTFENVGNDLRAAIDAFFERAPGLEELVIWGLCDAASAAIFYAHQDRRVTGLVLVNPWSRTEESIAKAYLKHYYFARLFDPELWAKILHGKLNYAEVAHSITNLLDHALPGRKNKQVAAQESTETRSGGSCGVAPLPEKMFEGLSRFNGRVLLIMSGNDLTAREFSDLVRSSRKWRRLLASSRIKRHELPAANHTFSRAEWRDQVAVWTRDWIQS